jgi:hypothetical protein
MANNSEEKFSGLLTNQPNLKHRTYNQTMDWLYALLGLAILFVHLVGIHAAGKNQISKGSPYWQGLLMGLFIPYYSFYCFFKYIKR